MRFITPLRTNICCLLYTSPSPRDRQKSPLVTSVIKKQINYARDNSVDDALDYHAIWNSAMISSSDMESAMKAYMEKVSGDFEDLEPKKSFWEKQGLIS